MRVKRWGGEARVLQRNVVKAKSRLSSRPSGGAI